MTKTPPMIPQLRRRKSTTLPLAAMLGIFVVAAPKWAMAQQITPVCDRTPGVRDEIVKRVPGKSHCADVDAGDLAGIDGVLRLVGPHEVIPRDPFQPPYIGGNLPEPLVALKAGDLLGTPLTAVAQSVAE